MQQTGRLIVLQFALTFVGALLVFLYSGELPTHLKTTTASALLGGMICVSAQFSFNWAYENALHLHRGAKHAKQFLKAVYVAELKKLVSTIFLLVICLAWLTVNAPYLVGNYAFVVFVSSIVNVINFKIERP